MHEEYIKDLLYARFHTHCYREMHFSCRLDINFVKIMEREMKVKGTGSCMSMSRTLFM